MRPAEAAKVLLLLALIFLAAVGSRPGGSSDLIQTGALSGPGAIETSGTGQIGADTDCHTGFCRLPVPLELPSCDTGNDFFRVAPPTQIAEAPRSLAPPELLASWSFHFRNARDPRAPSFFQQFFLSLK